MKRHSPNSSSVPPELAGDDIKHEAEEYLAFRLGVILQIYYLPLIIILGLIGNSLSLCVALQQHNRRISCCSYMATLALSDNGMLVVATYYWVKTGLMRLPIYPIECHIFSWLIQAFSFFSIYLIVFMTLDRCLAVRFPFKCILVRNSPFAIRTIILLGIIIFVATVPDYFYSTLTEDGTLCVIIGQKSVSALIYSWLSLCLGCLMPFMAILVMNTLIIITIRKRGKYLRKLSKGRKSSLKSSGDMITGSSDETPNFHQIKKDCSKNNGISRDTQLTIILLLVSFTLLLLTLPQYSRYIAYMFIDDKHSAASYATYVFIYNLTNKLYFTNNACNFYLYCLGSNQFRTDVRNLLRCQSSRL